MPNHPVSPSARSGQLGPVASIRDHLFRWRLVELKSLSLSRSATVRRKPRRRDLTLIALTPRPHCGILTLPASNPPGAMRSTLAVVGLSRDEIFARMKAFSANDIDWRRGRSPLYVFKANDEIADPDCHFRRFCWLGGGGVGHVSI